MNQSQPKIIIAPSILSSDFGNLAQECNRMLDAGADQLHVDIMDGNFVPNLTIGPPVIKSLVKSLHQGARLDCHLMVTNPEDYIDQLSPFGVSGITFHYEVMKLSIEEMSQKIRSKGIKVGLSLKPDTPVDDKIKECILNNLIDRVLIMTVQPGFGGQGFITETMSKVKEIRTISPSIDIQVDGGVYIHNINVPAESGANCFVSGTGIFGAKDPKQMISLMRKKVEETRNQ